MRLTKILINFFLTAILLTFVPSSVVWLQNENEIDTSYCFKYSFNKNDTLIYFVRSYDSIVIDYGEPLLKIRNEIHRVVCIGANKDGTFDLLYELIDFSATDIQDTTKVNYTQSDWLRRNVWLKIDSFSTRKSFRIDDTSRSGCTPGGPFQPHLFFPFFESCKKQNETWLIRAEDDLVENGLPIPRLRYTTLFKMIGLVDTLGDKAIRSEFIRTGQGSLKMVSTEGEIKITSVINSFGILDVSQTKRIPLHLFTTVEQKLTINSGEITQVGRHYIHTNYILVDYKPGKQKLPTPKKQRN